MCTARQLKVISDVWFSPTPDFMDKLGVGAHRSIAVWAHIHRPDPVSIGLVSKPRCASAGDCCFAPSDRSPATFREPSGTDASRSAPVGLARHCVVLEIQSVHHAGIDGHRMASQGIPIVLDMEDKA